MYRKLILRIVSLVSLLIIVLISRSAWAQASANQSAIDTKELAVTVPAQPSVKDDSQISSVFQYLTLLTTEGWTIGWSYAGPFRADQNLSNLITPDLLSEYQCQAQAKHILQRGNRKITIDAFQCATADGAYGIYCTARRGSSSYATQGDASSEDQESISFCKGPYFICIQSSEQDDDEAKTAVNKLAQNIIAHIELINRMKQNNQTPTSENTDRSVFYGNKPTVFNSMPTMERVRGSEKLIMGPAGMKRFFPAPYSANLIPLHTGAVADYRIEEPNRDRLKLLIAYYSSAQEAGLAYANYVSTLRDQNKEKSVDGFSCPTSLFKISDYFLLCQLRDKQVIVINGARHKDTLSELAHRIYF